MNFLPFEDLVKPLPDGTIPAVEVAKMASRNTDIKGVEVEIVCGTINIFFKRFVIAEQVIIHQNFDIRTFDKSVMPTTICNQVKIHNYLRSVGFNVDGVE